MAKKNRPKYEPDYGESEPIRETKPLQIPEILIRVLDFSDLAVKGVATRVCRRWSEPALEMIWRDQTDLAPFLRIFALLKNIRNSRMSPPEKSERIKSYGARIRALRFDASDSAIHESGTAEVFQALCSGRIDQYLPGVSLPASGLLPNLHTLQWKADEPHTPAEETLRAVSYFLYPTLKQLDVSGILGKLAAMVHTPLYRAVEYGPFLRTLTTMDGLRLERLDLQMRESTGKLADEAIPCLLRHYSTLIHFRAWTTEFVRHFQTELWGLPKLRSLEVATDDTTQAAQFVEGLADARPEIELVNLSVGAKTGLGELRRLWKALKRFERLTQLTLRLPEMEEVLEEDARSMREAWPALSCLFILSTDWWVAGFTMPLTRESLNAISRHFSQSLTMLGLYFAPGITPMQPTSPARLEKLQLLQLQSWFDPGDPEDMARYLARILPTSAVLKW
ncbi:hypothetical protein FRC04_006142 [Tulasnella sp. 424]|nr:hypothetical protein FRC04_006142 [Tulasnella sp. 424]